MPITLNSKSYTNDTTRGPDAVRYLGPVHDTANNDILDVSRTAAKPTATYAGKTRARSKLTRSCTDGATEPANLGDIIFDLNVSIPVGCDDTELATLQADFAAHIASAAFTDVLKRKINQ
jgi:hypothetical protein